jgi:hypothetical protein
VLLAQNLEANLQRVNMQSQLFYLACFLRCFHTMVNLLKGLRRLLLNLHCCKLPTDQLLGLQRLPRRQPL